MEISAARFRIAEGNDTAKSLYEKLGFVETGCRDGKEILMELSKLS